MITTSADQIRARGLTAGHFRRIADRGFGAGFNSYPYSYAWFNDHLYIGTNRNALQVIMMRWPFEVPYSCMPVPLPESHEQLDLRGQIWRYHPPTETWDRVFRAPMVRGFEDRWVPLTVGFRSMVVFQGASDPAATLYALPVVGRNAPSCAILRSTDGVNFERVSPPCVEGEAENFGSFRAVQAFKGRLWCSPSHSKGDPRNLRTDANISQTVDVRCTDDPVGGRWQISCLDRFGDPTNQGIIDMQACGDYLYVGTINFRQGFQVWRTDGEGLAPHRWEKVLDWGADRGPLNQAVLSMTSFNDNLYVGSCIQNGGHDRNNNIGPAAPEVVRVHANGQWDLVCGYPRMTRQGLKIPLSGMGPGFDNPLCGYFWRMCVHEGAIYVGTFDLSTFLPFMKRDTWPTHLSSLLDENTLERFIKVRGGAELWRSTDGENWAPVTRNGFDNPYNFGVRTLVSTPVGMFVGFANPFGPVVAVKSATSWRYEQNLRGGLEIWHGSLDNSPRLNAEGDLSYPQRQRASDEAPVIAHRGYEHLGLDAAAPESREAMFLPEEPNRSTVEDLERLVREHCTLGPVMGLALADKDLIGLNESLADEVDRYFESSPVCNAGYWRNEGETPRHASLQLVRELLALMPEYVEPRIGVIAAGGDMIASKLKRKFGAHSVKIFSEGNLKKPRARKGLLSGWRRKKICDLADVGPAEVDVLLWIEGPTRQDCDRALAQAFRVLRPGGCLLVAELFGGSIDDLGSVPLENPADSMVSNYFQKKLAEVGFVRPQVFNITRTGWQRFYHHSRQFFLSKLLLQQIDSDRHADILRSLPGGDLAVEAHLLISARKPPIEVPSE